MFFYLNYIYLNLTKPFQECSYRARTFFFKINTTFVDCSAWNSWVNIQLYLSVHLFDFSPHAHTNTHSFVLSTVCTRYLKHELYTHPFSPQAFILTVVIVIVVNYVWDARLKEEKVKKGHYSLSVWNCVNIFLFKKASVFIFWDVTWICVFYFTVWNAARFVSSSMNATRTW